MRKCLPPVIFLFCSVIVMPVFSQTVTANFTIPDKVCVNTSVPIQNTSTGFTNCYWSFCAADFNTTPQAVNLGNPSGKLSSPVFGCYQQDDNGNYYGLLDSYTDGNLIRLSFGSSLLNTPTAENLGTFNGAIPNQAEGIQLLRVGGNWTALIVGGGGQVANSSPRIVKLDFGNSLTNTPMATNWGSVGGLSLPHDLYVTSEAGNYYGFAINVNDNTITRLSFGPDFSNPPTGTNLGNIGNIDYPAGLTFIKYNGNWSAFIANRVTSSLTRLDFGTSLLNTPTGINIGNPGGTLDYPRDISLFTVCDGVYGFVVNETSNDLVKLNFGGNIFSSPQATSLGNTGNLSFPHSISDFFRVGNDIYAFIPNVANNTLTRIRFAGCSDIPGSGLANPLPVTYRQPGVYNVNLIVDVGLPTQTSFCRQITVNPLPAATLAGDTVCLGEPTALLFDATVGTPPFTIQYKDAGSGYTQNNLPASMTIPLVPSLTTTTQYTLQTVTDANGCMATPDSMVTLYVNPLPQGGITGNRACAGDSAVLLFQASEGAVPFLVQLSDGTNNSILYNVSSQETFRMPPISSATTFTLVSITSADGHGCARTSGFTSPSARLTVVPSPQVRFDLPGSVCYENAPFRLNQGEETSGLAGIGVYSGPGIDAFGNFLPSLAGAGPHLLTYTETAPDGSVDSASSSVLVNPTPVLQVGPDINVCGEIPVQLSVRGADSYTWQPSSFLDDAGKSDPVATVAQTTSFIVQGKDANHCVASDTVTIHVTKKFLLIVPNAFTPNGDGHNDCFGIQRWEEVTVEEFSIFNRYGQRIFTTKNPAECWDGTYKGKEQPAGGYAYVIKAASACGEVTRTGMVMLIR